MAPSKKSMTGRVLAALGVAAACYAAGSAFVAGSTPGARQLRSRSSQYAPFEQQVAYEQAGDVAGQPASIAAPLLAAAVAFGLVAGVNTQPARAALSSAQIATVKAVEVSDSSVAVAMKQFVNPSEELDADEQPFEDWSAEHPVQLILTGLIPVFIYLTFYVLGSLEVI
eukprot:TRINITY_DN14014_c1_g1_i1.p1 TRINITY_DN14014_c1_g1~~TRINITY_DN14014_c1_g1_i1.p1  ORF type:complete len:190 (+),score=54.17 TRINITY_DN14014_c1_g1_i1:65-571(+)